MKKIVAILATIVAFSATAEVVFMPDGKIVNCQPTSIGTIVCL